MTRPLNVALLGCGTVGGGVLKLLDQNAAALAERVGAPLVVKHVLVRDGRKARPQPCRAEWVTEDADRVLSDPAVDIVIEVMGGEEPAGTYLERAIRGGKAVVSANKLLIAKRGPSLLRLAASQSVDLFFEAAVGGGIPIIRTLREALTGDTVLSVHGILNGTCNYILTRMRREGLGFQEVLRDAQQLGYAEANPSMDVDGHDAAQKLIVVSMLAFGAAVTESQVCTEGIREVDSVDFRFAERLGFSIKHLAIAKRRDERLELRVHPAMVPADSVLANINDALNGVFVQGKALGPCLLMGQGAGALPTAVSVVSDLVDVARARLAQVSGLATRLIQPREQTVWPMDSVETRYYLRFDVTDDPGVLGQIANALGREGISVEQVLQEGRAVEKGGAVPILIVSHRCREASVRAALSGIAKAPFMTRAPRLIRIEDL
jgi:homoserine dehydrogenase